MTDTHANSTPESTPVLSKAGAVTSGALTKVPEATALFWLTKIVTTGMGETTSDWLGSLPVIGVAIGVSVALAALVTAFVLQFRSDRYRPRIYWSAVVMVSIFGTVAADVWHAVIGVPYVLSSAGFLVVLLGVLAAWYRSEGTLSIHTINTRRREKFYWGTVWATFALGTAAGDWTATVLHLGYIDSGLLFAVLIALPALAHWKLGLNAVVAFWASYIITRPLGASFADWFAVSHAHGGLSFGPGWVSLIGFVVFAGLLSLARDNKNPHHAHQLHLQLSGEESATA
ncbi:MAG: hypothetical protein JWR35_1390 [Marmoricola sp.]|nr:hypothetical protein [Marmoricola sp.]